jgi:hypothetical protein
MFCKVQNVILSPLCEAALDKQRLAMTQQKSFQTEGKLGL